jgi:diamine N-acetyltransferase
MITVRPATLDDADAIARQTWDVQQLHNEALPGLFKPPSADLFPAEKLATLLEDPNSVVAVAEAEGEVVGHVYGAVMHRAENAFKKADAVLYIHQIGIRDDVSRRGIGTALISFMHDRAVALGVAGMQLDHWAFNARARSFFEACGFSPLQVVMRRSVNGDR